MMRESRFRVEYNGKVYVVRSEEALKKFQSDCEFRGIDFKKEVKVTKLYPFSMERNQHNFMLVANVCANRIHDMEMGEIEWDEKEYDRLDGLKKEADEYFCLDIPIAWVDGKTYGRCRELANLAIEHRVNACVENGRIDLIQYC